MDGEEQYTTIVVLLTLKIQYLNTTTQHMEEQYTTMTVT